MFLYQPKFKHLRLPQSRSVDVIQLLVDVFWITVEKSRPRCSGVARRGGSGPPQVANPGGDAFKVTALLFKALRQCPLLNAHWYANFAKHIPVYMYSRIPKLIIVFRPIL